MFNFQTQTHVRHHLTGAYCSAHLIGIISFSLFVIAKVWIIKWICQHIIHLICIAISRLNCYLFCNSVFCWQFGVHTFPPNPVQCCERHFCCCMLCLALDGFILAASTANNTYTVPDRQELHRECEHPVTTFILVSKVFWQIGKLILYSVRKQ